MKRLILITSLFVSLLSCEKKSVLKTHPELVGYWRDIDWGSPDGACESHRLKVDSNGKGEYSIYSALADYTESWSGKVKTKEEDLYVDGHLVFRIIEIVDTTGYLLNPVTYPPSYCSPDSIPIVGLLKVEENGQDKLYYK
jgi:hypothetical protein